MAEIGNATAVAATENSAEEPEAKGKVTQMSDEDGSESERAEQQELIAVMKEAWAEMARLEAVMLRAQAQLNNVRGRAREVAAEIALALSVTENHAKTMVATAEALTSRLPRLLDLMDQGKLDGHRAARVVAATSWLSDEDASVVDEVVAERLPGMNAYQVRRLAYYEANKVDPEGATRRMRDRRERRRLVLLHKDDGTASLTLQDAPAEKLAAAYDRINRAAQALLCKEESRTLEQLRADVAVDLMLGGKEGGGVRTEVFLYMDMLTYLGLNNAPAELQGHGTVPAELARYIATGPDTTLRRIITDPLTGQIVELGGTRYETAANLEDFIRVRDRECRKPGCCRPAKTCQLAHDTQELAEDQPDVASTVGLCPSDRRLKGDPGWTFRANPAGPAGAMTVSTPGGSLYSCDPEPLHSPRPEPASADSASPGDGQASNSGTGGGDKETAA